MEFPLRFLLKIQESHFVLFYVWIVITIRESRFLLFFWKKHLTIITISLNSLSIPPALSLSKNFNDLMFSAPRCSRCFVRFSVSSFFPYLAGRLVSSRCLSVALPLFPQHPRRSLGSLVSAMNLQHFFWVRWMQLGVEVSFTVTAVKDCSKQILNCQGGSDFDYTHNACISIFKRLSST